MTTQSVRNRARAFKQDVAALKARRIRALNRKIGFLPPGDANETTEDVEQKLRVMGMCVEIENGVVVVRSSRW